MTHLHQPRPRLAPVLALLLVTLLTSAPEASSAAVAGGPEPPAAVWPLAATPQAAPQVAQPFDPPERPWLGGHRGVDLAGSVGQPVRSALAGTVAFVGRVAGVGVVSVDHGGTRTTYQPVTASVSRGDVVAAGDRLGTLAWYGTHCLPRACLHWGWLRGEEYLDPLDLLGGGPRPVRLLPLALVAGPAAGLARLAGSWAPGPA